MSVIEDFIKQYNKEFDFYQKLSQIVASKMEDQLFKRGIKAIVNNRAKRPDRLKEKIIKRNEEKNYKTVTDIHTDIIDLSGIRISLYFPTERNIIDEVINDLFQVINKKVFPGEKHMPRHEKRFSGYWATHYHIKIKEETAVKRYADTLVEIQVASVLMHAWSEVEHDLVYKPFSGQLSREELAILDEINGLVLSGEIALERLQIAMSERTKKRNDITNKYELTNFLLSTIDQNYLDKLKLGDTYLLTNFLNTIKKVDTRELENIINKINLELGEPVTDQLLDMLVYQNFNDINLKNYFKNLQISEKKASGFESFVKCWVVLEKAVRQLMNETQTRSAKYLIPDFQFLSDKRIVTKKEAESLRGLRRLRNNLLHAMDNPTETDLKYNFDLLKAITEKIIEKMPDKKIRDILKKEMTVLSK